MRTLLGRALSDPHGRGLDAAQRRHSPAEAGARAMLRRGVRARGPTLAALTFVALSQPAGACSPRPDRGIAADLAEADVVVRGKFSIAATEVLSETREVATIEITATHYLKWAVHSPPPRTFKVSQLGLFDETNCPPWYEDNKIVFFAFKKDAAGELKLSGTSSFFKSGE
ncbi:MAG TPA: hypothetical protein VF645_11115 [Allosphingosinicella sp.]